MVEGGNQRLAIHRLGQVTDRAQRNTARGFIHRGNEVHRDRGSNRIVLEVLQHRPTVHARQHHIQQDAGGTIAACQFQPAFAIGSSKCTVALAADQVDQDAGEGRIIFHRQDHGFTRRNGMAIIGNPINQLRGSDARRARRGRRPLLAAGLTRSHRTVDGGGQQRQHQAETAALVLFAVDDQLPAQQLRQAPRDRQAQTATAVMTAGAGIDLFEGLEDRVQALFGNTNAGITHRQRHMLVVGGRADAGQHGAAGQRHMQGHRAFAGELEGIAEQVVEHLLQLGTIGDQGVGHRRVHLDGELQTVFHRHVAEVARHLAGDGIDLHFLAVHVHLAGFDLGQIEDVVDQPQQVGTGVVDDRRGLHFLHIQMPALVLGQLLGQDQQAVERRTQLVRHIGQEVGLVLAGTRQLLCLELGFALQYLQHILLLVEHLGLLPQLLVGGLQFLGLYTQFFFRGGQALGLLFQLHGLALQLFVGGAQLFFLRLQGQLRHLQLFGLGAGVVQ